MQPRLPFSSLRIGYFDWSVEVTNSRATENHGITCKENKEIMVFLSGNLQVDRDTMLHEVLHALIDDKTDLVFNSEKKADDCEETAIRIFTPGLLAVLRDNPEFKEWLLN